MIKTNRSLGNFSEYGLKGDFTSFNLPNCMPNLKLHATSLNNNIKSNSDGGFPAGFN